MYSRSSSRRGQVAIGVAIALFVLAVPVGLGLGLRSHSQSAPSGSASSQASSPVSGVQDHSPDISSAWGPVSGSPSATAATGGDVSGYRDKVTGVLRTMVNDASAVETACSASSADLAPCRAAFAHMKADTDAARAQLTAVPVPADLTAGKAAKDILDGLQQMSVGCDDTIKMVDTRDTSLATRAEQEFSQGFRLLKRGAAALGAV